MPTEAFLTNPPKRVRRKSTKKRSTKKRRTATRRKKNPYGKEVIVVGRNPRRRKKRATRKRTVKRRRRNPVTTVARRRKTYRKRRNPVARKRVSRKRSYRRNPVRKRRMRRNMPMAVGALNFKKPMTLLMPIMTGVVSTIATRKVPEMLGLIGWQKTGAQLVVGIGGALILRKPLGAQTAMVWGIVSLVNTIGEMLRDRIGGVFMGYSAFVDRETLGYDPSGSMMSEYSAPGQYGAFVDREDSEYGVSDDYDY